MTAPPQKGRGGSVSPVARRGPGGTRCGPRVRASRRSPSVGGGQAVGERRTAPDTRRASTLANGGERPVRYPRRLPADSISPARGPTCASERSPTLHCGARPPRCSTAGIAPLTADRTPGRRPCCLVAAGSSVADAAARADIRPTTAKRHLADLRARSGLTTEQLVYCGRAEGWLVVPDLELAITDLVPRPASPIAPS
jgi:hypothetical protein